MKDGFRRRAVSLVSIAIFVFVLTRIWKKVNIIVWSNVPWWGLLLVLVVLYFLIELAVRELFGKRSDTDKA